MPDKPKTTYRFTVDFPHAPDYVIVEMDRRHAFDIAKYLLAQLSNENQDALTIYLLGELQKEEDEDGA